MLSLIIYTGLLTLISLRGILTFLGYLFGVGYLVLLGFSVIGRLGAPIVFSFGLIDLMSLIIILLRCFIRGLIIISRVRTGIFNQSEFKFYILVILVCLVLVFSLYNFIGFYVFFEAVLIPITVIIFKWGNQPERLQAGKYILFYTLFGSLPLLITLLMISKGISIS